MPSEPVIPALSDCRVAVSLDLALKIRGAEAARTAREIQRVIVDHFDRTVTRLIRGRARVAGANDGRVRWLEVVAFTLSLLKGLND